MVSMITIIGTGHVFKLSEPIMFLIKHIWPEAVLVELDYTRYKMLTERQEAGEKPDEPETKAPWIYRRAAKYQQKIAEENGSDAGSELVTAVLTGEQIGAKVAFIDTNATQVMNDMWEEMPFRERMRYSLSSFTDGFRGKKRADAVVKDFGENEEAMIADMRRRYPTLVRKLIDERNASMAEQIRSYAKEYNNIVVVCGDAHVEGISAILSDLPIKKIRLRDITDKERLDRIRSEAWNHEGDTE